MLCYRDPTDTALRLLGLECCCSTRSIAYSNCVGFLQHIPLARPLGFDTITYRLPSTRFELRMHRILGSRRRKIPGYVVG